MQVQNKKAVPHHTERHFSAEALLIARAVKDFTATAI